ncbi:hypothetical protein [Clostridium botulinum]|uniref:hypothetical protein n=1 Tax=Clostridium botulinum TaxID=1491 RepID=UPI0012AE9F58|nr:hypothetical protein [Clostridium botulinum]
MQLQGTRKKDAVLVFNRGLNVVAGASDTGKSFAYECINYILGSTDTPEIPNEANGYEWVLLEFLDKSSNQKITLKRSLLDNVKKNIYYIYADIDNLRDANYETLSNSSNAKNNLSSKLLALCNCSYRNILKKSTNGETEAFTFRKFVYLMMMNETRIVQKNSPIYMGDTKRDRSTKEASSFFTILSGLDYQKYIKPESIEVKKAQLKGAIDELTLICNDLHEEITVAESTLNNYDFQQISEIIKNIENSIKQQRLVIEVIESERGKELAILNSALREKSRIIDNLSKFKLLKKNYKSDIDRLEFIEQSHDYTVQLVDVKCPICHTAMRSPVENKEIYYIAIDKEKDKLKAHLLDLQETIYDFEQDLLEINKYILNEQEKIKSFESRLEEQAKQISKTLTEHDHYQRIRDKTVTIQNNKKKLFETNCRIQDLNERIDNTKATSNKVDIKKLSDELMIEFCKLIQELLQNWNFIDKTNETVVEFNGKANDVIVCGKTKSSYGKGARAIINSSFIIAIMQYCKQNGLSHPGFVVLDSPLTTYKEKYIKNNEKNEEVSKSVKISFFNSVGKVANDSQIIIFDNEVPPDDLTEITYHHFTGNTEIDRRGFIPRQ